MPRLGQIEHRELDVYGLSALLLDVSSDRLPGATIPNRGDVVAIRPELPAPEFGFDIGQLEAALRRERFDETDHLSAGILGQELAEDVDVVLVEPDVVDVDGESLFEPLEDFKDRIDHRLLQNRPPVFDCELDVVIALRDVVVAPPQVPFDVDHGPSVPVARTG
jgi:hypothetical protein